MHTLRSEFAHVALFYGGGQGILVASEAPLVTSSVEPPIADRAVDDLLGDVLLTTNGIDAFVADVASGAHQKIDDMVSTDDNLYIEYATPRGNVLPWGARDELVARLRSFRSEQEIGAMRGK